MKLWICQKYRGQFKNRALKLRNEVTGINSRKSQTCSIPEYHRAVNVHFDVYPYDTLWAGAVFLIRPSGPYV